jgi:osmotically-inducible protein OsmY|tara:strand:- start:1708 stop:2289 length:582 start_codon:yes stop_codon:yes gene_type:complete
MSTFSRLLIKMILIAGISTQLTACFTAAVGGAVAGGAVALDRRTTGIYLEDENIEIKAVQQIRKALGDEAHVNVISYNLSVLLTGEVPNAEAKAEAENITKSVKSVKNITNELTIGFKSAISDRAKDTYLTSKIKAKFIAEKNFSSNTVKIVTEAKVAYLLGIVNEREAALATEIARTTDGVEKVVKVFEYQN